jgi:hypothetical protein
MAREIGMEKYNNDYGKECFKGVTGDTPLNELEFHTVAQSDDEYQAALHTNLGSLTVVDRMTGFGWRDTETGYRSPEGKFWLASGGYDVRHSGLSTMRDAIEWVKRNANTCVGA